MKDSIFFQYELLKNNIQWFIQLRWMVIAFIWIFCVFSLSFQSYFSTKFIFCSSSFLWIGLLLLVLNLIYILHFRYFVEKQNTYSTYWNLYTQILLDLLVVSYCTYLLGGIENPFICTFLFHVILVCIFLKRLQSFVFTTIAIFLTQSFTILEFLSLIPQKSLLPYKLKEIIYQNWDYLIFYMGSVLFIAYTLWHLVSTLSERLKKHESMLAEYNQKLIRISKERSQFMLLTSHEFKAPLAAIQSYAHVLLKGYQGNLPEKVNNILTRIYERCNKLNIQVKEMIQLANINSITVEELPIAVVSLNKIVESVISNLETVSSQRHIELKTSLETAEMKGNAEQLEIMVSNLIANAITYSKDYGQVHVFLKKKEEQIELKISDQGIGIAPENLEKIFQEHFCAANAIEHNKYCTGLGLAIVKSVLKNHNAKITVESDLNQGSTFTVFFKEPQYEKNTRG
ncbi:MAG: HAMP domain-containing histidine kinase [Candidatus Brocadiae bacterium]|nr:HAMP domain-containing histidine kinase [Candidatus Brocadiia bacterium]